MRRPDESDGPLAGESSRMNEPSIECIAGEERAARLAGSLRARLRRIAGYPLDASAPTSLDAALVLSAANRERVALALARERFHRRRGAPDAARRTLAIEAALLWRLAEGAR